MFLEWNKRQKYLREEKMAEILNNPQKKAAFEDVNKKN